MAATLTREEAMETKKPTSEAAKAKKNRAQKGIVRDLTAWRDAADAVRGGVIKREGRNLNHNETLLRDQ
jgi:hypothetical protein